MTGMFSGNQHRLRIIAIITSLFPHSFAMIGMLFAVNIKNTVEDNNSDNMLVCSNDKLIPRSRPEKKTTN